MCVRFVPFGWTLRGAPLRPKPYAQLTQTRHITCGLTVTTLLLTLAIYMTEADAVIIDYEMGNVGSIRNMLKYLGFSAVISRDEATLRSAKRLILAGVGAFDGGMNNLNKFNLIEILSQRVFEAGVPIIGLCLGMQLFTKGSDEGAQPGLGWLPAYTKKFRFDNGSAHLKIPHMGWNQVVVKKDSPLVRDLPEEPRFYFVHSYYCVAEDPSDILLETEYGGRFTSGMSRKNVFGVQFHPEKSHKFGMRILDNFVRHTSIQ